MESYQSKTSSPNGEKRMNKKLKTKIMKILAEYKYSEVRYTTEMTAEKIINIVKTESKQIRNKEQ